MPVVCVSTWNFGELIDGEGLCKILGDMFSMELCILEFLSFLASFVCSVLSGQLLGAIFCNHFLESTLQGHGFAGFVLFCSSPLSFFLVLLLIFMHAC